uniref:Uncharacterized protein n=1 Tax=Romanomermis culicivorax TaxID=13658 RepID=A0A915L0U4_ROMCU
MRCYSLSLLSDDIGSSPGKLRTKPPHGWTSRRTSIFGDSGAVAVGKGDASMMLRSSLMAHNVSPKAFAATDGELVVAADGCCWAITDSIWALVVIIGGNVAMAGAGWAIRLACSTAR